MYSKIILPKFTDNRGELISMELIKQIPFEIERIFFIKCKNNFDRGNHAHKNCHELLIPVNGSFNLELDDGTRQETLICNQSDVGIIINPRVWLNITNIVDNCIILAICSHPYTLDENISNIHTLQQYNNEINFTDLQNQKLSGKIHKQLIDIIRKDEYVLGTHLEEFEVNFAKYNNIKYCVGLNNGSTALLCAIKSLNLPYGSHILVQSNAFIAAPLAITECGFNIKLVDITESQTIDLDDLDSKITDSTKALILVHLYGDCCDMDKLMTIINKHNIRLIEDTAQAHGAEYKGKKLGTFGEIGCFSFYPSKNLGCIGEGGCIITNDYSIYNYIKKYRNYGGVEKYSHDIKGLNYRMENIQAAVLNIKLPYLDDWNMARHNLAKKYIELLNGLNKVKILAANPNGFHVYHLFVILVDDRENLMEYLKTRDIPVSIHYPTPFYKTNAFKELNNHVSNAELYSTRLLSLPIHPDLTKDNVEYICNKIKLFYGYNK